MNDANPQWDVSIDYTNWKGERSYYHIRPTGQVVFRVTEYHPEPQWLLEALDVNKGEIRLFAMRDIHKWKPFSGQVFTKIHIESIGELARIQLLDLMTTTAAECRLQASESIKLNNHLNDHDGSPIPQTVVDAVMVHLINLVGVGQCVDYALHASDLPTHKSKYWNMDTKLIVKDGELYLPGGCTELLLCVYPEGDCDAIKWPQYNEDNLRSALFDARETGEIPLDSRVLLPNGEEFKF